MPFSVAENLVMYYQQQFPDLVIAKSVAVGPNKMPCVVAYLYYLEEKLAHRWHINIYH